MRLGELTAGLPRLAGPEAAAADSGVEISGLAYDSRAVQPGSLFFCVTGFRSDGHDFAAAAVRAGAAALVVERPLGLGVPELHVASARRAMGPLAARFFGDPAGQLRMVGVTGTNGKTTSAYLVQALLQARGASCGLLGTVKSVIGGQEREVQRTTPEAIDLHRDLRAMLDAGDAACVMEVSSHALELGRADAVPFAAALFTNLTQDHLDFHPTMEDYFLAKRRLFVPDQELRTPPPRLSVINAGDSYGRRLSEEVPEAVTFAVGAPADYRAEELRCGFAGCEFKLITPAGERDVRLPMPGHFNVANALGALAVAHGLGEPLDVLVETLERGVRVPGRFEPVERGQDFAVLVDYAHTPDSLQNVLQAARELIAPGTAARVICVFGAGGDRDRGKRPLMGEIAARLADVTIVTSDNPRSEPPATIIQEILAGTRDSAAESGGTVESIEDRRTAIDRAVELARGGDVLVIAGKGHEQGQELEDGRKIPFDDVTVAREALDARLPSVASAGTR
ncbi:MAG: UDP-N-acetylmuramoyl-L-alanyl-D-glutamate--2,6-diaminopimelate ligase [Solirubrobacteraceae bacterium]|nr:UDP-N-acetylmuramyl-tripeptide synthetase [Solirubrobacterales bacterium]MEA2215342.1 UDP-N-acetylmuramoyl-L-alanyl-D-glutamate--2,6-diaminopimelate ligase [Solirubrobacteraceae bacterium]